MRLFSRRGRSSPAPRHLPLGPPRLDGSGWPDEAASGRPSFAAAMQLEVATRNAFDPPARAVADVLLGEALAVVATGASADDEPHLRGVLDAAARIGAGLGRVERGLGTPGLDLVDRGIAAALWQARRDLPGMGEREGRLAAWFLLAGHRVARADISVVPALVEALARDAAAAPPGEEP